MSKRGKILGVGCLSTLVLLLCIVISVIVTTTSNTGGASVTHTPTSVAKVTQPTVVATAKPTRKPTATPKPIPTQTGAQIEADYKASTTDTTVVQLDKDGAADQALEVHFTGMIFNFVKDSTGNTVAMNVSDSGSDVQVTFPLGTDITQLNAGDTIEVWGTDMGVSSGSNAFGATIQEVVVSASYMNDQTTNYQVNG